MQQDKNTNGQPRANLALLTNLECLLGLACLILLVHALRYLFKFSQVRNCFIGDMMAMVKIWNGCVFTICGYSVAFTQDHMLKVYKEIVWNTVEHAQCDIIDNNYCKCQPLDIYGWLTLPS